jgi:regulator of cell morphogenesis and NO signaling
MPTITETVREIAVSQPTSIRVFERFGIDYCCGGHKPLAVACNEQGVELDTVLAALAEAAAEIEREQTDWSKNSLEALVAHINSKHHEYLKAELPRLNTLAKKVTAAHGVNHPELAELESTVQALSDELTQHLAKEELVLFPYVTGLERALAGKGTTPHACFGSIASPIAVMSREHDDAGEALAQIRKLTKDYSVPQDACPTYHAYMDGLKTLEQDLHQHIHLENNILFPRAMALEGSAMQTALSH